MFRFFVSVQLYFCILEINNTIQILIIADKQSLIAKHLSWVPYCVDGNTLHQLSGQGIFLSFTKNHHSTENKI